MSVVYLSNTGLMEPLGQSQILAYLSNLSENRRITVISLEKSHDLDDTPRRNKYAELALEAGLRWMPLRYHSTPALIAPVYDLLAVLLLGFWICATSRITIVHARGFVIACAGLALKKLFRVSLIYDSRALSWINQRVELGMLRERSVVVTVLRSLERRLYQAADVIVVLSSGDAAAIESLPEVAERPGRVRVITTCTDLDRFTPSISVSRGANAPFIVGYVGNAGRGYLFDPVLEFFGAIRARVPSARLKIVNRGDHALIRECVDRHGLPPSAYSLTSCDYDEVPKHIADMTVGVFFYHWSKSAVPPLFTRMGEFLACGVPCVSNVPGAGTTAILEPEAVGICVSECTGQSLSVAADRLLSLLDRGGLRERCVAAAERHFSLRAGVQSYETIYRRLEQVPV